MFPPKDQAILIALLSDPSQAAALSAGQIDVLLQLGAVTTLETAGTVEALSALSTAVALHPLPEVREQAFNSLIRRCSAGDPLAADALFSLALEHDHLASRQHILASNLQPARLQLKALLNWFQALEDNRAVDLELASEAFFQDASSSLRARILASASRSTRFRTWGRLLEALSKGQTQGYEEAVALFPSLSEVERRIFRGYLTRDAHDEAREALCSVFILHEDSDSRDLLLKEGFAPAEPSRQALFLFLTGQMARYHELDFDHNLLVSAYERAGKALRRRILSFSRQTGQIEWLRSVGQAADVRYLGDLGDADWDSAIGRLFESDRFGDLWRLAQIAPARWSAVILARLTNTAWRPLSGPDSDSFAKLSVLASDCWRRPLDLQPYQSFHAPSDDLTCLSIDPRHNLLAGGTTGQHIYIWQIPSGDLNFPALIGPANITRALAFSPDGEYLATADGDQRIRIFRNGTGQVIKTIEGHRGLIRGLAIHPSGRILVSAGFDGQIRTWRFPLGTELKRMESDIRENFCVAVLADGETLISAGVGWNMSLWKISDGTLLRRIPSGSEAIVQLAAGSSSELFASAGRDRAISIWNATSGLLVKRFALQPATITGISFLSDDHMLVTAGGDGSLYLWNLTSNDPIARLKSHSKPILALTVSGDGQILASADETGEICLWNFSTLLWIRRAYQPGQPVPFQALQDRLNESGLTVNEKRWLEFTAALWQWARRFDIEISESFAISLGEYDIEL